MKKLTLCITTAVLLFTAIPTQLKADIDNEKVAKAPTEIIDASDADAIEARIEEIKEMDKSELTAVEKKELRNEVRTLERENRRAGSGVHISAGVAIIIVLLLIILL